MPLGQVRAVVKVSGADPNNLHVEVYSIDQDGQPSPASSASFQDGVFKYAIQQMDSSFEGKISADGQSISGTVTLGAISTPIVLERATPATAWTIPPPRPKIPPMAADANPAFEVATIKPSKPGRLFISMGEMRFSTRDTTLADLIKFVYGVQDRQVAGPNWIRSDKFDIAAEPDVPGVPDGQQWKTMVQKLMADRFQLKFHWKPEDMSVYVLRVAKNGSKMHQGDPNGLPSIGFTQPGVLTVRNATMGDFAQLMQMAMFDRPVVDQTGLQGRWDFVLKWSLDESRFGGMGSKVPPPSDAADAPPPLFTAIQEQIGLKLEAKKVPVPVLVIDHVEPPSPN